MHKINKPTPKTVSATDLPDTASAAGRKNNANPTTPGTDEYLTVKEAARFLKVSKSFLDKRRCSGDGPSFTRIGRKILYRRMADLEAWARQRRFENTSQYGQRFK
jgi:hypothetical protein